MSQSRLYRLREAFQALGSAQDTVERSRAELLGMIRELESEQAGESSTVGERPEQVEAQTGAEVAKQ